MNLEKFGEKRQCKTVINTKKNRQTERTQKRLKRGGNYYQPKIRGRTPKTRKVKPEAWKSFE